MNYWCSLCLSFPPVKWDYLWHLAVLHRLIWLRMSVVILEWWKFFELENYWAKIYRQPGHGADAWFRGGDRLRGEGRMSAALWPSPVPLPLGWSFPAFLRLSDLLLCLGRKGPDVSLSKNLSEMTQMCSWVLPTCCSPNVLACLILPCMSAAAGRRRRGPSSPHLSLCRSQTGLDRIAAALTGAKATWKLHSLGQAPWTGWTRGYGLTPKRNGLEEHGLSPLSQP